MTPDAFEAAIHDLTRPVNAKYPRPWMTAWPDPLRTRVFIVGANQAKGYDQTKVTHQQHLDALFSRHGQTCRGLYDALTDAPSKTRPNIDALTARLAARGVRDVLETNVVCYSTPMSSDLRQVSHQGGAEAGAELFQFLVGAIRPAVLIAHGRGTHKKLASVLGLRALPPSAAVPDAPVAVTTLRGAWTPLVICIGALAPPAWNAWMRWAPGHLDQVADIVAERIGPTRVT
jgi:hypothetical protein